MEHKASTDGPGAPVRDASQLRSGARRHLNETHGSDQVALRTGELEPISLLRVQDRAQLTLTNAVHLTSGTSLLAPGLARKNVSPVRSRDASPTDRSERAVEPTGSGPVTLPWVRLRAPAGFLTASKTILRPLPPPSPHLANGTGDLSEQLGAAHMRIAELEYGHQTMMQILDAITSHLDMKPRDLAALANGHDHEGGSQTPPHQKPPIEYVGEAPRVIKRTTSATRGKLRVCCGVLSPKTASADATLSL